jgi:hypothetical protein
MVLPLSPFRTGADRHRSHEARSREIIAAPQLIGTRTARGKIEDVR